jgi:hypothetical protein
MELGKFGALQLNVERIITFSCGRGVSEPRTWVASLNNNLSATTITGEPIPI